MLRRVAKSIFPVEIGSTGPRVTALSRPDFSDRVHYHHPVSGACVRRGITPVIKHLEHFKEIIWRAVTAFQALARSFVWNQIICQWHALQGQQRAQIRRQHVSSA